MAEKTTTKEFGTGYPDPCAVEIRKVSHLAPSRGPVEDYVGGIGIDPAPVAQEGSQAGEGQADSMSAPLQHV
jgi:hypothetical protein